MGDRDPLQVGGEKVKGSLLAVAVSSLQTELTFRSTKHPIPQGRIWFLLSQTIWTQILWDEEGEELQKHPATELAGFGDHHPSRNPAWGQGKLLIPPQGSALPVPNELRGGEQGEKGQSKKCGFL